MSTQPMPSIDQRLQRFLGFLADDPDNASLRADIFEMALTQGAFDVAQQQVEHMSAINPADPVWRHRLVLLRIAQGRYAEARQGVSDLQRDGYSDPAVRYNLAYIAFRESDFKAAHDVLLPLLSEPNAPQQVLPLLLRCMHRLGAVNEALALFDSKIDQPGTSDESFGVASLIAIDAGELQQAATWAERALTTQPMQMEALVARGSAALAEQDTGTAMRCLQPAVQLNPQDGRTWSALGIATMLRHQFEQSLQCFHHAVRFMPDHIGTWHGMAWCQLMLKDVNAARHSFERALELDRNFGESHGGLAVTQAMQGSVAEATESIERALRLDPKGLSARYAQAVLNGDVNDPERFRTMAEHILGGRTVDGGRTLLDVVLQKPR